MGKLFGRSNPNYTQANQLRFTSSRQPRALPTINNPAQATRMLKTWQQKIKHVQNAPSAPGVPQNFSVSGIPGGIQLSWGQVIGADGYVILRSATANFSSPVVIKVQHKTQTFYIDAVGGGQTFYYRVAATAGTVSQPQLTQGAPTSAVSATSLASASDSNLANIPGAVNLDNQVADGTTFRRLNNVASDNNVHVSSALNPQGSVVNVGAANPFSYSSTTSSIQWTWSAFTIYFLDNTSATVASGSANFTGLAAGTTYYFYAYVTLSSLIATVLMVPCGGGTCQGGVNVTVQANLDGRVAININFTGATTTSGTGGGSAGGGGHTCFTPDTKVETLRGSVQIAEVRVGDQVKTARGTWKKVTAVTTRSYNGPALDMGGGELVTPEHLFLAHGKWVRADSLKKFPEIHYVGTIHNLHVETDAGDDWSSADTEHSYTLANGWTVHNVLT